MDILKELDKITEYITELESIKEAANDFIKHFNNVDSISFYTIKGKTITSNVGSLDFEHLRSLLKGKE